MSDERPFKVGQLVVTAWGEAKTVQNRAYQIVSVTKLGTAPFNHYRYTIRLSNGKIEENTGRYLITFEEYNKRLHVRLERQYSAVSKQEKRIIAIQQLEKDAKKIFKVDSKEEHCVTSQV